MVELVLNRLLLKCWKHPSHIRWRLLPISQLWELLETTGIEPVVRPKSKRRPGLTRRKAKPDAIPVDKGGRAMPDLVQGDELESLDIENRKLKTLLLEKIREENA